MRPVAVLVAAGALASAAGAGTPQHWAGLDRAAVEKLARSAVAEYTKAGAGPTSAVVIRHYWHGHEAWVVRADFTCAGGHFPTIVLWRGSKPFRPGESAFMCRAAAGKPVICRELAVC